MDRIALPIGSSDFKDIRTSGDYYVDKTAAISQFVHDSSRAIQFTRPRRFGKTTFITMLRYFFDIREKSEGLFEGLKILQDEETCAKWMNKVPVIYLTLNSLKRFIVRGSAGKMLFVEIKDLASQVPVITKTIRQCGGTIHSMEVVYTETKDMKFKRRKDTSVIKILVFPKNSESLSLMVSTIRSMEDVEDIYVD